MIGKAKPSPITRDTLGETVGWKTIPTSAITRSRSSPKTLTNRYLRGYRLPLQGSTFRPLPRVIHRTTHLLVGRLFGDSSELSQGILSAPTTKPTPDEGIQGSITSSHECQHLGITVPSMKYLSSRKTRILQRTYVVVPITHGNPLPHAPHSGSRGRRLTLGSTYQSDGYPTKLPCSPSDSGRSAASTASI